jgi:hypothetical protein
MRNPAEGHRTSGLSRPAICLLRHMIPDGIALTCGPLDDRRPSPTVDRVDMVRKYDSDMI